MLDNKKLAELRQEVEKIRQEMGEYALSLPSCLGSCDECDYRLGKWVELIGNKKANQLYYL